MHLSAKTHLASLATLELSMRHDQSAPVSLRTIADAHDISAQFLVQILLQLKRAGLVRSVRGASGGYRLMRGPSEISLLDVVLAMEGPLASAPHRSSDNVIARVLGEAWTQMTESQQQQLSNITFDRLVQQAQAETADMYYI